MTDGSGDPVTYYANIKASAQVYMEKMVVTYLRLGSREVEEGIESLHFFRSRVGPRVLEGRPEGCAQALHICVSVLCDKGCDGLGALKSEPVLCKFCAQY